MSENNSYEAMRMEYIAIEVAKNIKHLMNEDEKEALNLVKELMKVYASGIFCYHPDYEIYNCTYKILNIYFDNIKKRDEFGEIYIPTTIYHDYRIGKNIRYITNKYNDIVLDEIAVYRQNYYQDNIKGKLIFTDNIKYLDLTPEIIEDIFKIHKTEWTYSSYLLDENAVDKLLLLFTKNVYVYMIKIHLRDKRDHEIIPSYNHLSNFRFNSLIKHYNSKKILCLAVITLYQVYFSYFERLDLCPYIILNIISQIKIGYNNQYFGDIELDKTKTLEQIIKIRDTMKLIYQNKQSE